MEANYKPSTHKQTTNSKKTNSNTHSQDLFIKQFQDFYNLVNPMYGIRAKKKTIYDYNMK